MQHSAWMCYDVMRESAGSEVRGAGRQGLGADT